ncbi:MAG: Crp/Fnr family transcriptional regulator [Acetobacteraceae bacterium]
MRLVFGQVLIEAGAVTEHVFFPEEGVVSLVADVRNNRSGVQVAMIGREGLVGGLALLGPASASFASAVSQIPGPALRIRVTDLRRLLDQHPALRDACMLFVQSLARQAMQNAACNAQNTLAERCVRWLLMADDRVERSELPITHEALSRILGVRRAGVTVVAAGLQEAGLIRVSRGRITILDRPGLERLATDSGSPVEPRPDQTVQVHEPFCPPVTTFPQSGAG